MSNRTMRTDDEKRQIVTLIDKLVSEGKGVNEACKKIGINPTLYYGWRKTLPPVKAKVTSPSASTPAPIETTSFDVQTGITVTMQIPPGVLESMVKNAIQEILTSRLATIFQQPAVPFNGTLLGKAYTESHNSTAAQ